MVGRKLIEKVFLWQLLSSAAAVSSVCSWIWTELTTHPISFRVEWDTPSREVVGAIVILHVDNLNLVVAIIELLLPPEPVRLGPHLDVHFVHAVGRLGPPQLGPVPGTLLPGRCCSGHILHTVGVDVELWEVHFVHVGEHLLWHFNAVSGQKITQ